MKNTGWAYVPGIVSDFLTLQVDLTAREAEIIRIIRVLNGHSNRLILIGGYATSALGAHRFSVDCDVVITEGELSLCGKVLREEGYTVARISRGLKGIQETKTVRYVTLIAGRRVYVDLFVNSVRCRDTQGEWRHKLILQNSVKVNIVGITDSTPSLVPNRELLIAMKLHAARDTDLRDIVMLGDEARWDAVAVFVNTGVRSKLVKQLDAAISGIQSKEFPDGLKAEFGLRIDVLPLIGRTVEHLKALMNLYRESKTAER